MTLAASTDRVPTMGPAESAPAWAPRVDILGVRVSVISAVVAADAIAGWAAQPGGGSGARYVCATSVHGLIEADRDPGFRDILNGAELVVPDGMPLVWFGRCAGHRKMQRVYGPSLMLSVCDRSRGSGARHFFFGGAPGVVEQLAARLQERFPGLQVAGTHCPPFRPLTGGELDEVVRAINRSAADIVWVGLSTPKQERWIDQVRGRLTARVLVSVGAAFDFHAGRVRQAPAWVQRMGLEWFFRLTQEPGRLWRRYAYNNPRFVYRAGRQLLGLRDRSTTQSGPARL